MKRSIALITLAGLALAVAPSHAGPTVVARYTAGTGGTPSGSLPNPFGAVPENIGYGGYDFNGVPNRTPRWLTISDDAFGTEQIGVLVNTPSVQIGFCSPPNGRISLANLGLKDADPISVAVAAYETGEIWLGTEPCTNAASTGTLTLEYV